jgi:hypothetical protein
MKSWAACFGEKIAALQTKFDIETLGPGTNTMINIAKIVRWSPRYFRRCSNSVGNRFHQPVATPE